MNVNILQCTKDSAIGHAFVFNASFIIRPSYHVIFPSIQIILYVVRKNMNNKFANSSLNDWYDAMIKCMAHNNHWNNN